VHDISKDIGRRDYALFALMFNTGARVQEVLDLRRRYAAIGAHTVPTLRGKRLHPHSIRHSTAIAWLEAGVDFATISLTWTRHALR
jgi:site-specific recombinase XerD